MLSPCPSRIQEQNETDFSKFSPGIRAVLSRSGAVRKDSWAMGTPVGVLVLQRGNEDTPAAPWNSSVPSVHGIRRHHMNFLPHLLQDDALNTSQIKFPLFKIEFKIYECQHYLQLIIPAARRLKPGSVARGRDRARRVPCDDVTWAPLERRSRDAYHGCANADQTR